MILTESKDKAIAWARNVADFARHRGHPFEADEIELAIKAYSERKLSMAIIGLNKRGKSTFCNGLLGRSDDSLAPVDWQPATGVVSSFSYSEDRACADVIFEDGRKEEISYERIRDYVLEKNNPQLRSYGVLRMGTDEYGAAAAAASRRACEKNNPF